MPTRCVERRSAEKNPGQRKRAVNCERICKPASSNFSVWKRVGLNRLHFWTLWTHGSERLIQFVCVAIACCKYRPGAGHFDTLSGYCAPLQSRQTTLPSSRKQLHLHFRRFCFLPIPSISFRTWRQLFLSLEVFSCPYNFLAHLYLRLLAVPFEAAPGK